MKILSLVGARPQFIKEAVINRVLRDSGINEVLVNSGQHYDHNMAGIFFQTLGISSPQYNLKVGSGKHGVMTGEIMARFEKVLEKEKPDIILVYGDTNTTLAGALVSAKLKIPIAHVEAGVRMLPKDMPEEINRVVVDHVSNLLFCCSDLATKNLYKEGIKEGVYFVGDVMYDLFLKFRKQFSHKVFRKLRLKENDYVLLTLHRDYNVDDEKRLKRILRQISKVNNEIPVVFPMHPRTKNRIKEFRLEKLVKDLKVLEPIDYLEMMGLLVKSKFVMTDSGGLQKESYFGGKRSFVVMPDPAWRELTERKINVLCNEDNIYENIKKFADKSFESEDNKIYGAGNSAELIVRRIKEFLR